MKDNFDHLATHGYELKFGDVFNRGWEFFKKDAWLYIAYTLIFMLSAVIWIWFMYIPYIGWGIPQALTGGYYSFARASQKGDASFGNFFNGFTNYFQLCNFSLFSFLLFLPVLIIYFILVGLYATGSSYDYYDYSPYGTNGDFLVGLSFYGLVFLFSFVQILFSAALPLIVDRNLSAWKAMGVSFSVLRKKYWTVLGILLVTGLITMAGGIITCYLGFLATIPFAHMISFALYTTIFDRTMDVSDLDSFGMKNPDINTESEEDQLMA